MTVSSIKDSTSTGSEQPSEAPVVAAGPDSGAQGPENQQEAVKRAYSEATTALKETHRDEFNADVAARVTGYGFTWTPRPTKAESAKAKALALLQEAGLSADDLK